MQSLSVDSQGQVVGAFSNGQTIALADITLATFNGQDSLAAAQRRGLRGHARIRAVRSTARPAKSSAARSKPRTSTSPPSSASLIVAQQAYSANARVMTTANQMIQSLLQVIQ